MMIRKDLVGMVGLSQIMQLHGFQMAIQAGNSVLMKILREKLMEILKKSLNAHSSDSSNITFIFVTPRRWPGKDKWIQQKKDLNKWKDVRVYDANDLEQWLEQSLPAKYWLANEAKLPTKSVASLDSVWREWANVCEPKLNVSFFTNLFKLHEEKIRTYLTNLPEKPFYIAADSTIEAIAFFRHCFRIVN